MNWFNSVSNWFSRKWDGFMPFNLWSATPMFNNYTDDIRKLQVVFSNPALLKVFCLQCDLFAMGKVYAYKDGKDIGADPALDLLSNPNPFQNEAQLKWDFMFWKMMGTSNVYLDSNILERENNKIYMLENQKLEFPLSLQRKADKLIFSKAAEKELFDTVLTYRYSDGETINIPLRKVMIFSDLTNGVGNWFKSNSRIDSLYKIIANSEASLDSENINIRYSGKFLVAGASDPNNVTQMPLSKPEQTDVESIIDNPRKSVQAVKTMVDIKRFVENMGALKLNEKYLAAFFLIGTAYNIPRDVLEAYASGTYENQEKARGAHVGYTLQPAADELMNELSSRFGYLKTGKRLVMSWDHMPFMQVFEKDRSETKSKNAATFVNLIKNGVPLSEVNEYLDTNFTKANADVKAIN